MALRISFKDLQSLIRSHSLPHITSRISMNKPWITVILCVWSGHVRSGPCWCRGKFHSLQSSWKSAACHNAWRWNRMIFIILWNDIPWYWMIISRHSMIFKLDIPYYHPWIFKIHKCHDIPCWVVPWYPWLSFGKELLPQKGPRKCEADDGGGGPLFLEESIRKDNSDWRMDSSRLINVQNIATNTIFTAKTNTSAGPRAFPGATEGHHC